MTDEPNKNDDRLAGGGERYSLRQGALSFLLILYWISGAVLIVDLFRENDDEGGW